MNRRRRNRRKVPIRETLRNHFNNLMSRGTGAKLLVLFLFNIGFVIVSGVLVGCFVRRDLPVGTSVWAALLHTLDAGVIADDHEGILYLAIMLIVTVFGMLFTGTMVGIINNGITDAVDKLGDGYFHVHTQHPHTLILGWSEFTPVLVRELSNTDGKKKDASPIVVMDKGDSYKRITEAFQLLQKRKDKRPIICCQGDVFDPEALERCDLAGCRSVVISARNDFETIRAIIACRDIIERLEKEGTLEKDELILIAILLDHANEDAALLAGRGRAAVICYDRVITNVLACAGRTAGLSDVYLDMFSSGAQSLRIIPREELRVSENCDVMEVNDRLASGLVLGGRMKGMQLTDGEPRLFPAARGRSLNDYSRLLVMERKGRQMTALPVSPETLYREELIRRDAPTGEGREASILILGCNRRLDDILDELNDHFCRGKCPQITLAGDDPRILQMAEDSSRWPNLAVRAQMCDLTSVRGMEALFDHKVSSVIVLSDESDRLEQADQSVISRLIFLRQIQDSMPDDRYFNISCELNMKENRTTAEILGAVDMVVGTSLVGKMAALMSEEIEMAMFLYELLGDSGAEIRINPVADYLRFPEGSDVLTADLFTLSKAARLHGQVLLGIHRPRTKVIEGLQINPERYDGKAKEYEFRRQDNVIVLAD